MTIYKVGNLRADKVKYLDGTECSVWYPFIMENGMEDSGICFDFNFEDIDDMINLLLLLKTVNGDTYPYDDNK